MRLSRSALLIIGGVTVAAAGTLAPALAYLPGTPVVTAPLASSPSPEPAVSLTAMTFTDLDLSLTSQVAVADWNGEPVVVGTYSNKVILARMDGTRTTIGTGSTASVSSSGGVLRVAYIGGKQIHLAESKDGKSWTDKVVGTMTGSGAALPVVCNGTVGYVDMTVPDSDGPLYIGATKIADHAATVSCTSEGVYWRDQRNGASKAEIHRANLDGSGESTITMGYDASAAACGDLRVVGFHDGVGNAWVTTSTDAGKTWTPVSVDDSGKFVSVSCYGTSWLAAWGDYTDKAATADAKNSDGKRRLGVMRDGKAVTQDGTTGRVKAQASFISGSPLVVWGESGTVKMNYLGQ